MLHTKFYSNWIIHPKLNERECINNNHNFVKLTRTKTTWNYRIGQKQSNEDHWQFSACSHVNRFWYGNHHPIYRYNEPALWIWLLGQARGILLCKKKYVKLNHIRFCKQTIRHSNPLFFQSLLSVEFFGFFFLFWESWWWFRLTAMQTTLMGQLPHKLLFIRFGTFFFVCVCRCLCFQLNLGRFGSHYKLHARYYYPFRLWCVRRIATTLVSHQIRKKTKMMWINTLNVALYDERLMWFSGEFCVMAIRLPTKKAHTFGPLFLPKNKISHAETEMRNLSAHIFDSMSSNHAICMFRQKITI